MNYARYAVIHARHLPRKVCLIERTPSLARRRTLTWKQFNGEINRVANYLFSRLGIGRGDYVLHLQHNSLEWLVSYYAIIKIGAVVVPLNFRFAARDVVFAAEVCRPRLFIFGSEFNPLVEECRGELSSVEVWMLVGAATPDGAVDFRTASSFEDASEAIVDVSPDHELAMMFTSGTTGAPKAVLHTHGSIDATAMGNGMSYFVEKDDNYLLFLPLYHSGTMFLWAPFYATGATGTILREFSDPAWILEAIAEESGTDTLFVVPVAIALLNALDAGHIDISRYDLTRWKYLEIGAQPVPFDVLRGLVEHLPCGVSNIYGITEGGGGGTFNLYPGDVLRKPGSIGRPTFGVEARIVGDAGKDVSAGKVGELTFRTPRMMKEYFHNTQLTETALEEGWLRTGDLVRMDDEGYFYIVDRKKDMISSGGENIYPVEIEDALMNHPKIDDVACIGCPDPRLVEVVLAIVQTKEGESMTQGEVIDFARECLALYKAPRRVIFDQVMRNPTGKLMKPQMREKYTGRPEAF